MTSETHYDTLGLPPDATAAEIREAFVRLVEAERQGNARLEGDLETAGAGLPQLTAAYQALADPRRRAEHDWRLGIDDLQPLDWGGALPEPYSLPVSPSSLRRYSPLGWLRALRRLKR